MPTDSDIENIYDQLTRTDKLAGVIPQWGEAIAWHELHHQTPYKQNWD